MSEENNMLSKLDWAINTIRDKLLFGRDELGGALAREMRAKGVMLDAVKYIKELEAELGKAGTQNNLTMYKVIKNLEEELEAERTTKYILRDSYEKLEKRFSEMQADVQACHLCNVGAKLKVAVESLKTIKRNAEHESLETFVDDALKQIGEA